MSISHRFMHSRRGLLDKIGEFIDGIDEKRKGKVERDHDDDDDDDDHGRGSGSGGGGGGGGGDRVGAATIVRTVYKTMEPTFKGPVGGYSTVRGVNNPSPTESPKKDQVTQKREIEKTSSAKDKKVSKSPTSIPSVIHAPSDATTFDTILVQPTGEATGQASLSGTYISTSVSTNPTATSSTDSPSSSGKGDGEQGSSPGAKAGIAFGVLGGVLLVGLIVFLVFNRHRRQAQRQRMGLNDEKLHGPMVGAAGTPGPMSDRAQPNTPRISLRPVTQFLPTLGLDKRASKGTTMVLSPTSSRAVGGNAWERPSTSQSNHPANPFGTQAERIPAPIIEEENVPTSGPTTQVPSTTNAPAVVAGAVAGATAITGAAVLTRKTSMRSHNSPPGSAGSSSSGAIPNFANSAVHRVQLDFKPTLEDEMQLKAGELVRLLHEYDDGWALCTRMDRSQQGVVPRTCLSTRPVKPRPQPGGVRPGPPVNPSSPGRPPNYPLPHPLGPQGMHAARAGSPGFMQQGTSGDRPHSPSNINRAMSPSGPNPMNPAQISSPPRPGPPMGPIGRKPVPGQAY